MALQRHLICTLQRHFNMYASEAFNGASEAFNMSRGLCQTMALQRHLICTMKPMTFGRSTGETRELILTDEWFGYAESECFSTTRSLTQRILNALNRSMFLLLQMLRMSSIHFYQSRYKRPSQRLSNTKTAWILSISLWLEKHRQWWKWLESVRHQYIVSSSPIRAFMVAPSWCGLGCRSRIDGRIHQIHFTSEIYRMSVQILWECKWI